MCKLYGSIVRWTLFSVLEECGVDVQTRAIIKQRLAETIFNVKFQGEISEAFEIITRVSK